LQKPTEIILACRANGKPAGFHYIAVGDVLWVMLSNSDVLEHILSMAKPNLSSRHDCMTSFADGNIYTHHAVFFDACRHVMTASLHLLTVTFTLTMLYFLMHASYIADAFKLILQYFVTFNVCYPTELWLSMGLSRYFFTFNVCYPTELWLSMGLSRDLWR